MSGEQQDNKKKKIIFLAAVLAAGILIYVLFGRTPANEEVITFTETPLVDQTTAISAPKEEALIDAFKAAFPQETFNLSSRDGDAAIYAFAEEEYPATLTLTLSSGRVTMLEMAFALPKFPEPLSADATAVEKGLREKRQQALESAVTEYIYRFQLLTEQYAGFYWDIGHPGLAADAFRAALLEGRSDCVESENWQYELFSLTNNEEFTAKIAVTYLGDTDKEG